ncbi:MAG: hypothetical protein U0893_06860 [Chloroflexota bacterium]
MSVAPHPSHNPRAAFQAAIGAIQQRIWLERAGVVVTRGMMLGFLVTLGVAAGAWYFGYQIQPLWYAVPLLAPLLVTVLISLFLFPSAMTAARILDRRLDLAEQLATAVEIVEDDPEDMVPWAQVATASDVAGWAQENWRGGPRLGRDLALTAALGFLAAGALLLTGPEGRSLIPRPPAPVSQDDARPSASPAAAAPKPEQKPQTPPQPQQQNGKTAGVQRAIADIKRSRENGSLDAGEASRRLGQAEGELSRQTQQSRTDQQALDRLGQALDQIAAGHQAAEALRRGDYEQAAREIAQLGTESDQLSQEAKTQLAQALRAAANDSPNSPELGQSERRAADALTGRDYDAARQAMSDLADQVNTRSRNVIPQSELNRAWDALNQERRAEGQPESNGSARNNQDQQRQQQGRGQQPGQGPQQGQGQSNQPQNGQGIGTAPSNGGPPGQQQDGDPAPRLDSQGQQVQVELKPGQKPGSKPGDADKPDDRPLDESGPVASSSSANPGQITSAAPPEINFVPSGRRDIVRQYFQGPGENRSGQ